MRWQTICRCASSDMQAVCYLAFDRDGPMYGTMWNQVGIVDTAHKQQRW